MLFNFNGISKYWIICQFPMLFNGINIFFSILHQFSILFNGDYSLFLLCQFPMLFNRNFCILYFFINFPYHSMEVKEIFIFCLFSMLFNSAIVHSNLIEQKSPCVLQDIVPFGAATLLTITYIDKHTKQGNGYRWLRITLWRLIQLLSSGSKGDEDQ